MKPISSWTAAVLTVFAGAALFTPQVMNAGSVSATAPKSANSQTPPAAATQALSIAMNPAAATCSGAPTGNESMLSGQYAALVQGGQGALGTPVAIAASFHADGAGNVSGGDFDINDTAGAAYATINASSYTVGPDSTSSGYLGCVALSLSNGLSAVFRFSLGGLRSGVFSKGRIIEFDDATGTGTRDSGVLLLQDTTSFALSHLQPRYAYGVDGVDSTDYHFASAGSFTVDTSGNISNAFGDTLDGYNGPGKTSGGTGAINAISTTTGRTTMSLPLGGQTTHQAAYMVNADEFFMIGTDPLSSVPIYSGRAIVTASSFSQSSLSGNYIMHTTAKWPGLCMVLTGGIKFYVPCTTVHLWLVNANSGALSGTLYFYSPSPAYMVPWSFSGGTYAVDATSGRTTASGGQAPVCYLATPTATTEPISAFAVGPSTGGEFGFVEFQPSATYSTSGMAGNYLYGTHDPADYTITNEIGVVKVSSEGTVTGSEYDSGDSGLGTSSPSGTMSIGSDGSGSWQFTYGDGCLSNNVAITNGTRVFVISHGGGYCNAWPQFPPAVVTVFELQSVPLLDLSAGSLSFGNQPLSTTSAAQAETATNTGTANLTISTVTIGGANAGDFAKSADTCTGATLTPMGRCTASVTFTPSAAGSRSASLIFTYNASDSPQTVSLTGTGTTTPVAGVSPSGVMFGSQNVGTTSGSQPVTLSNTGTGALTITSIAMSANFGETDTCGGSVAPSGSCTISVTFNPTVPGPLKGTVVINDNAAGTPQTVIVTGVGAAASLSPASLTFSSQSVGTSSPAQTVTLGNSSSSVLNIWQAAITGANASDFAKITTCGSTLAASATCTFSVAFTPSATGSRAASLLVSNDGGGSPQAVPLSGSGVTGPSGPSGSLSTTAVSFGGEEVGTGSGSLSVTDVSFGEQEIGTESPAHEAVLTNAGKARLEIGSITITGDGRQNFTQTNDCGASLASGARCTLRIRFAPQARGTRRAMIRIVVDGEGGAHELRVSGVGRSSSP